MIKFETSNTDQAVSLLNQMEVRYCRLGSAFIVSDLSDNNKLLIEYLCKSSYSHISHYDLSVWEGNLDATMVN